jgi:hypothetical protein
MKVKNLQNKGEFKPKTIKITFESQEEINDLYNRVNLRSYVVEEQCGESFRFNGDCVSQELYNVLRKLV